MHVAVVTGAGRGLGRALAQRLARRGLAVLVTDVDGDAAERTARELGEPAWSARHDVRDAERTREIAREAAGRGRLAVWVNNAGIMRSGRAWDHPDGDVELIAEVNFVGLVQGSLAAVRAMRNGGGGRILNVASLSSFGPVPNLAVYGATKHAVLAFSLSLQGELDDADIPIEVRSLCPDTIDTQMVRDVADQEEAAILWSGPRVLDAGEVADRAMELLYGRRLKRVIPPYRGLVLRSMMFAPRRSMRLLPLFERIGAFNRRRWKRRAA